MAQTHKMWSIIRKILYKQTRMASSSSENITIILAIRYFEEGFVRLTWFNTNHKDNNYAFKERLFAATGDRIYYNGEGEEEDLQLSLSVSCSLSTQLSRTSHRASPSPMLFHPCNAIPSHVHTSHLTPAISRGWDMENE
jgi:hypothetical protein